MPGLEKTEQTAKNQEVLMILSPTRAHPDQRPERQHGGINAVHRKAIGHPPENQRSRGEGITKDRLDLTILGLGHAKLLSNPHRQPGQGLPVHVVDRRGQQQHPAHRPLPDGTARTRWRKGGHGTLGFRPGDSVPPADPLQQADHIGGEHFEEHFTFFG